MNIIVRIAPVVLLGWRNYGPAAPDDDAFPAAEDP
jgi:hypothetical protein